MNEKGRRMSLQQQAARIAREAATLGMDGPTFQVLLGMHEHLIALRDQVAQVHEVVTAMTAEKDWYSTKEVADLMGVTAHTVQARWCAAGRIESEKDPTNGHWRIPGHEFSRLRRGGKPLPP